MVSSPAQGNITYAGFRWKIVNIFMHFSLAFTFNGNRMIEIDSVVNGTNRIHAHWEKGIAFHVKFSR